MNIWKIVWSSEVYSCLHLCSLNTHRRSEDRGGQSQERNKIRQLLTSFFRHRRCFTMVRPVNDEDALACADELDDEALRPEFREQLHELAHIMFEQLASPKTAYGRDINGSMLLDLARTYVEALNSGAVPNVGNAFDAMAAAETKRALEAAQRIFDEAVSAQLSEDQLPLDEEDLFNTLDTIR